MTPVVAVIAPGMMGAGVGKRLADNGVKVLTSLKGRSEETVARAKSAGMVAASDEEIASCDFILSILPPGDEVALAERFAPALKASNAKPVYVDCNAINPATVDKVAAVIAPTDCPFVDSGIIGAPPKTGDTGPRASWR
jgi:L-threonate 2-dehydrogenase